MSGLISSLVNSNGALRVHSKSLEITGKNLANINNRGYSKQRVDVGDRGSIETGIATESMGVEALELRQNRDVLLDKSVMREYTAMSGLEAAKKVLENAQTALGQFLDRTKDSSSIQNAPSSNGGGISDVLSDFFNAWESFSVKPNDVGVKQLLIEKADILSEKINLTDQRLAEVQSNVDAQIDSDLIDVNGILNTIAEQNAAIAKAENGRPNSAVDLRDQRQAKLEELSKYFKVSFENKSDSNGQITVSVSAKDGSKVLLVNGTNVNGFVSVENSQKFLFNGKELNLTEGALVGQLDARNKDVQTARDQISKLTTQLVSSINGAYSVTGKNFFAPTPATGKLIEINSSLTVASLKATNTANAGANELALSIAELANKKFVTPTNTIDGTFNAYYNSTVSQLAQKLSTTDGQLEDQKLSEQMARSTRDEFSGVSQDEEMTDMMKFQRSFQATARHINVIDDLLDLVVNRLGKF